MRKPFFSYFLFILLISNVCCHRDGYIQKRNQAVDTICIGTPLLPYIGIDDYISLEPRFPKNDPILKNYLTLQVIKYGKHHKYISDTIIAVLNISNNGRPSLKSFESVNNCKDCIYATRVIIDSMPYWIPALEYDSSINAYKKVNGISAVELIFGNVAE